MVVLLRLALESPDALRDMRAPDTQSDRYNRGLYQRRRDLASSLGRDDTTPFGRTLVR
jgi:hypothetical protein